MQPMNNIPSPINRKPPRRILRKFFFGVAILFGVLLVCFAVWRIQLRREINARIAAIRAQGLPTDWEELSKWPKEVSDDENAALIYTNAIAHLHPDSILGGYFLDLPLRSENMTAEMRVAISMAVETNHVAMEIARTASGRSKARYPINHLEGPNALLPHLGGLKNLVWLEEFDAILKAEAGDSIGAAKAVENSIAIAQSLDGEPVLISQLASASMLMITCESLKRVLSDAQLSDESLIRLSAQLSSAEATNRFMTGLIGERALYMEFIRLAQDDVRQMIKIADLRASDEEKTELPSRNPGFVWRALGFFERDRAFFLRAMETNLAIARMQPPASLAMTNEIERIETKARKGFYILSSLLLPSLSHTASRDAHTRANLRTALASVAIERWRLSHNGSLPDSLNVLVPSFLPAVPVDPYDGQALRFKKLARGYIVYSIGQNKEDDGGKERPARTVKLSPEQRNRFDITFTVER